MENRTALRGAGISKWLIALFAVIVVLGLGVIAAYVAKGVSAPAATQTSVSTEAGQTCPISNCNLRSSGSTTDAGSTGPGIDEPAYSFDPSVYGLVP